MRREEVWFQAFIETLRKNGKEGTAEKAASEATTALAAFDKIKKSK